jgi:hypothetical protein
LQEKKEILGGVPLDQKGGGIMISGKSPHKEKRFFKAQKLIL